MELSKIRFKGYDVNGSSLIIHDDTKGGKYRVKFSKHSITSTCDEDGNWMFVDVSPTAVGFEADAESEDSPVFEASISLTLSFECDFKDEVNEDFYAENAWFFQNFIFICTKVSIDNILKDTVLEDINLPWSQPF